MVRHQTLTLAFVGSSPAIPAMSEQGALCSDPFFLASLIPYDPLAQQAEQLPFKQWVWSSNLQRVTTKNEHSLGVRFLWWRFEIYIVWRETVSCIAAFLKARVFTIKA